MNASEVVYKPVRQLAELVRERRVSPTTLAEIFLERLERIGPRYNAVVTLMPDRAMEEAKRAEREIASGTYRGPLHGVPYGLKDLFAAVGAPTSWGAMPFKDQVFHHDSTVARKLNEAGAVLLGKLALVEIAGGIRYKQPNATFTGPGINPWGGTTWAGRFVQRFRLRRQRRACSIRHWIGNVGVDHHALLQLRHRRPAPHVWPRQPSGRNAPLVDARQAGAPCA